MRWMLHDLTGRSGVDVRDSALADLLTEGSPHRQSSRRGRRAMRSAVFVGAGPGKFATDENVSAAGFDPLVVQFALGD